MLVSPGLVNLHAIANLDLQVLRMDASNESTFPKRKVLRYGREPALHSHR